MRAMTLGQMNGTDELCLALTYEPRSAVIVSLMVREMDAKGLSPELFIEERDPGGVSVVFRLPSPSIDLLRIAHPMGEFLFQDCPANAVELVATGESDFALEDIAAHLLPCAMGVRRPVLVIEDTSSDVLTVTPIPRVIIGQALLL